MFDYIIIGGGSAGGVLANRLSEDPNVKVCLLEAGGKGNSPLISMPGGFGALIQNFKINKLNWRFQTLPDETTANRSHYQPRGKSLGGSSSINGMVYIRGDKEDYNTWHSLGNEGWCYDDVLPYFKKAEGNERPPCKYHSDQGPLHVTTSTNDFKIQDDFLQAGLNTGYPLTDDFNGASQEGIGMYQVTAKNGKRASVKACYLDPILSRKNLTIHTKAQVSKVIFEGKTAVGVEYIQNGQHKVVKANKEIIVSGGAFGSPQILLLSGVGPQAELKKQNIPLIHDLPGVGKNLQEHPDVMMVYRTKHRKAISLGPIGMLKNATNLARFLLGNKNNWLGKSPATVGAFLKTDAHLALPDYQIHSIPLSYRDHAHDYGLMTQWGFSLLVNVSRPKSRGEVTLKDANPLSAPNIKLNLLSHPEDMITLREAFKKSREIVKNEVMNSHIKEMLHPQADLTTDKEIEDYLRENAAHAYHPVGSCKMGHDDMAVVDDRLKVHGLQNLRVVDASIMPTLISGNTNAPSIMIGEKAADMIKQDNQHNNKH